MPTIELAPEHGAAQALARVIDRRAKDLTHRCLKRREQPALGSQRPYTKTQLVRDLLILTGMFQAYGVICGIPVPQETLFHFDNARRAVEELR